MKNALLVAGCILIAFAATLATRSCVGDPTPQDTHTGILKGTIYDICTQDPGLCRHRSCDQDDRPNAGCDGEIPR